MTDTTMRPDMDQWWRSAVIYQVYPRSFADSGADGLGDLPGIISKLDYLAKLGVDAIWVSPFYPSPQADAGYDVADYFDINPDYGTLADYDKLVSRAHALGIKVIIDVVPNHSSSDHKWFKEALAAGPNSPERDRYIFRYSEDGAPNNWGSMFGGPAWSKVDLRTGKEEDRGWWYLHLFDPEQPDFNWKNPQVHELFRNYLRFWCEKGTDGFRVDVAHSLVKAEGLPDDTIGPDRWNPEKTSGKNVEPYYDQDGVHEIYREWRKVLDEFGRDRMLVAEAWVDPLSRTAKYVREDEMSQAFNFAYLKAPWQAAELRQVIDTTRTEFGKVGAPVTWVLSNHDVVRHATRLGYEAGYDTESGISASDPQPDRELGLRRALAATTFMMGLPGGAYIYQGEELGLPEHTTLDDDARQDPTWFRTGKRVPGRDGCRIPLPWVHDAKNYGFGTGTPWLPQPELWAELAADLQEQDSASPLAHYRHLLSQRRAFSMGTGDLQWVDSPKDVLAFTNGQVLVALNLGEDAALDIEGEAVVATKGATVEDGKVHLERDSAIWVHLK